MKAISTFVAAIMLIAFTVAAGVLLSIWFTTYTSTTTAGVGGQTEAATKCAGAIKIVYASPSATKTVVVLTKTDVKVNLTSAVDDKGNTESPNPSTLDAGTTSSTITGVPTSGATWVKVSGICYVDGYTVAVETLCREGEDCWST